MGISVRSWIYLLKSSPWGIGSVPKKLVINEVGLNQHRMLPIKGEIWAQTCAQCAHLGMKVNNEGMDKLQEVGEANTALRKNDSSVLYILTMGYNQSHPSHPGVKSLWWVCYIGTSKATSILYSTVSPAGKWDKDRSRGVKRNQQIIIEVACLALGRKDHCAIQLFPVQVE